MKIQRFCTNIHLFLFKGICVHGEAQRQFGQKEKYEINFKAHNVNGERKDSILYVHDAMDSYATCVYGTSDVQDHISKQQ